LGTLKGEITMTNMVPGGFARPAGGPGGGGRRESLVRCGSHPAVAAPV